MTDAVYRNHPLIILKNAGSFLFIGLIMVFSFGYRDLDALIAVPLLICIIMAAAIGIAALFWSRTTICLESDSIIVESRIVYKKKKTVPYSKIASANIIRTLFDRIFGTTTLHITINSSQNAAVPNVNFIFKKDLAEKLRAELMKKAFDQVYTEETESVHESVLKFRGSDAVLYGAIGGSSAQFIAGGFFTVYSVLMLFLDMAGFMIGVVMMLFSTVIPMISQIIRYYGFKIYRVEDNIRIEHGAIQTYRTSFDVNRINAVRIKRTFFAGLLGKCCIEAEVVGINAVNKDVTPLLSLLIDDKDLDAAMEKLLPEFICDIPVTKEPGRGLIAHLSRTTTYICLFFAVMAYPCIWLYLNAPSMGLGGMALVIVQYGMAAFTLVFAVCCYLFSVRNHMICRFGTGKEMFRMVTGPIDRCVTTVQYDRVQISHVFSSPAARRLGLARCDISLLSSMGSKTIRTGFFEEKDLEKISGVMMERLRSGEYDYRKNSI